MKPLDDDLDRMLKAWTVPRSPGTLEGRLRRAYAERARSRTKPRLPEASPVRWIAGFMANAGRFAGAIAGALVLLAVITRAFPQSLSLLTPPAAFTMDSEFLVYADDGSYTVSEYRRSSITRTSSVLDERETTLFSSFPGDPLRTAAGDVLTPLHSILDSILHPIHERMQEAISPWVFPRGRTAYMERQRALAIYVADRIQNGCTPTYYSGTPMTVIGEETVLNYSTTVSRTEGPNVRVTKWFAPGLGCVSLRTTTEKALGGGVFRLATERRVVKVTMNSSRGAEPAR